VIICVVSLQERLGLTTKDAAFSAVRLNRDQLGVIFLELLGLKEMGDLLAVKAVALEDWRKFFVPLTSDIKFPSIDMQQLVPKPHQATLRLKLNIICYLLPKN
jgi:hypothetical protein